MKAAVASVVIPNWNGKDILRECLKSLEKQTFKDFEVIVVENGSTDGSYEMMRADFPDVEVIRLPQNVGFAPAVNKGIELSRAKYIVLMNNDTEADKDWLKELVGVLEDKAEYDMAAAKMLFFDKRTHVNTAGDVLTKYGWAIQRGFGQPDKNFNKLEPIFAASGGAAIYRRSLFRRVGLFDDRFFAYLEDVDLAFRAQLQGHKCLFVPDARIYHHVSVTTKRLSGLGEYLTTRNTLAMIYKNYPSSLFWLSLPNLIFAQLARIFMDKNPRRAWQAVKAQFGFLRMLPYLHRQRRQIRKSRKVPVSYIRQFIVKKKPFPSLLWGKND